MIEAVILAALASAAPHPCVHRADEPRPRVTRSEQRLVKRVIGHVVHRVEGSDDLGKLLLLVAERESSWQPGVVHRLPEDLEASLSAWRFTRRLYEGNSVADDAEVWQTYGLFGMNSSYFTVLWDKDADPRVLCDAVVDVLVYRRALTRALRKLSTPILCDGIRVKVAPTWAALHAAVSGGRMCPQDETRFRRRAARRGLDADSVVTVGDLGHEPVSAAGAWSQTEMLRGLWAELSATTGT